VQIRFVISANDSIKKINIVQQQQKQIAGTLCLLLLVNIFEYIYFREYNNFFQIHMNLIFEILTSIQ